MRPDEVDILLKLREVHFHPRESIERAFYEYYQHSKNIESDSELVKKVDELLIKEHAFYRLIGIEDIIEKNHRLSETSFSLLSRGKSKHELFTNYVINNSKATDALAWDRILNNYGETALAKTVIKHFIDIPKTDQNFPVLWVIARHAHKAAYSEWLKSNPVVLNKLIESRVNELSEMPLGQAILLEKAGLSPLAKAVLSHSSSSPSKTELIDLKKQLGWNAEKNRLRNWWNSKNCKTIEACFCYCITTPGAYIPSRINETLTSLTLAIREGVYEILNKKLSTCETQEVKLINSVISSFGKPGADIISNFFETSTLNRSIAYKRLTLEHDLGI